MFAKAVLQNAIFLSLKVSPASFFIESNAALTELASLWFGGCHQATSLPSPDRSYIFPLALAPTQPS